MQRYLKTENSQLRRKQRLLIEKRLTIVIYTNIVSLTYREQLQLTLPVSNRSCELLSKMYL